jgi:hypothetical protein
MIGLIRDASLGRKTGHPPGRRNEIDRSFMVRCERVVGNRVDVVVEQSDTMGNQRFKGLRVKQPWPCNRESVSEILPEVGDLGIMKFLDGKGNEPYWDGWLVWDEHDNFAPVKGRIRHFHAGVEIITTSEGAVTVRTKVRPGGARDEGKGVTVTIGADDTVKFEVPDGKTIQVGGDSKIVLQSFIDTIASRVSTLEGAIETMMDAIATAMSAVAAPIPGTGVGGAITGALVAFKATVLAAKAAYSGKKDSEADVTKKARGL